MADKPVPAKIVLTLKDKIESGERFISLSTDLYQKRLIYGEPRELRKNNGNLELIVIFRDQHSFENWLKNEKIVEYWSKDFEAGLVESPVTSRETNVLVEIDGIYNCDCAKTNFFLLYGRAFQFSSELVCGDCLGNVSYSKIPLSIEIEQWQNHHERIYMNWLDSSFLEGSALRQLKNYRKGKLNLEGEKIRKQLSDFFRQPVYLVYFFEEPDLQKTCCICEGEGVASGLKRPGKICKKCFTAFDFSEE